MGSGCLCEHIPENSLFSECLADPSPEQNVSLAWLCHQPLKVAVPTGPLRGGALLLVVSTFSKEPSFHPAPWRSTPQAQRNAACSMWGPRSRQLQKRLPLFVNYSTQTSHWSQPVLSSAQMAPVVQLQDSVFLLASMQGSG